MISILDFLRILGGGVLWLIVISLTLVLWRTWHLIHRDRVDGMMKTLFHIILAGDMFVLWSAIGAFSGLWLSHIPGYVTIRIIWWFVVVCWLFGAIMHALICITRELYRDQKSNEI